MAVTLTARGCSESADLVWTTHTGTDHYRVRETVPGTVTRAASVAGLSYTATGLTNDTEYTFEVDALDAANVVLATSNAAVVTPGEYGATYGFLVMLGGGSAQGSANPPTYQPLYIDEGGGPEVVNFEGEPLLYKISGS